MKLEPEIVQEARVEQQRPAVKIQAPRYPLKDKRLALEEERLKARRLGERLLLKKAIRTGQIEWRIMQRLGDEGRKLMPWVAKFRGTGARYMPASEMAGASGSNVTAVLVAVQFVALVWAGFYRLTGSWNPLEW